MLSLYAGVPRVQGTTVVPLFSPRLICNVALIVSAREFMIESPSPPLRAAPFEMSAPSSVIDNTSCLFLSDQLDQNVPGVRVFGRVGDGLLRDAEKDERLQFCHE